MTIYEVRIDYTGGTFFTDKDPTRFTSKHVTCKMAYWDDSYERVPGWKERREADARAALKAGNTRETRIRRDAVAVVVAIPDPEEKGKR